MASKIYFLAEWSPGDIILYHHLVLKFEPPSTQIFSPMIEGRWISFTWRLGALVGGAGALTFGWPSGGPPFNWFSSCSFRIWVGHFPPWRIITVFVERHEFFGPHLSNSIVFGLGCFRIQYLSFAPLLSDLFYFIPLFIGFIRRRFSFKRRTFG